MSRFFLNDVWYFVTVPTAHHRPCFQNLVARHALLKKLEKGFHTYEIVQYDFSVMSDHYHFIGYFTNGAVIPQLLKSVNGPTAMFVNKQFNQPGTIWGEYHIYIATTDEIREKITGYVIGNPLKHGEVADLEELSSYPFSTFQGVMKRHGRDFAEILVNNAIALDDSQFFQSLPRTGINSL